MLLHLLIAEEEGKLMSVTSVCLASAAPVTTALRWITGLTDAGLVCRQPHPDDRRVAFVRLTPDGASRLRMLLADE
jgi:DNA-binding MarR family transcriptional regulator